MKNYTIINESESTNQIKRAAVISYSSIAINIIAGLLYTPWMIEQIGQNDFGLYSLATSLISIFLLDFGLSAAVSRFLSKYHAERDQNSVNNILGIIYKFYFLIGLVLSILLILVYFNLKFIYQELSVNELNRFEIVYVIIAIFSIISFPFTPLNGILTSYEKFVKLRLCDLFNKLFSIFLIVVALLNGYGLYALVTANAFSGLITIAIKLIMVKKNTSIKINFGFTSWFLAKEIFSFSMWSTIISIAQRFIFNITPSVLGAVSGTISISIFAIASLIEGYIFTIANAINGLFLPKVTRIVNKDDASSILLKLMIKIGRIQLIIIGLIIIGFISIGKDFIYLWIGADYITSYYCAILLILPSIIDLPQYIGNTAVIALNKIKLQSYVFAGMAIVNIILSLIFSWFWGALGAALAICFSYLLRSIGMNIIFYKSLRINIFVFFKECHIKLLLPLMFTLAGGYGIGYVFPMLSIISLLLKGIILVFFYLIVMWFFGFNNYEKNLVLHLLLRVTRIFKR
ncbi:oligosaccharide flippase family protein [Peribacillus sp. NPDC097206]|uniref:oligosaccharide flippase family protein n=1 Tax=unclassified Peribacillus TaxID=2675266 RepID=UPI0037FA726A